MNKSLPVKVSKVPLFDFGQQCCICRAGCFLIEAFKYEFKVANTKTGQIGGSGFVVHSKCRLNNKDTFIKHYILNAALTLPSNSVFLLGIRDELYPRYGWNGINQ